MSQTVAWYRSRRTPSTVRPSTRRAVRNWLTSRLP